MNLEKWVVEFFNVDLQEPNAELKFCPECHLPVLLAEGHYICRSCHSNKKAQIERWKEAN